MTRKVSSPFRLNGLLFVMSLSKSLTDLVLDEHGILTVASTKPVLDASKDGEIPSTLVDSHALANTDGSSLVGDELELTDGKVAGGKDKVPSKPDSEEDKIPKKPAATAAASAETAVGNKALASKDGGESVPCMLYLRAFLLWCFLL